jgi:gliding motility-associated-like protein
MTCIDGVEYVSIQDTKIQYYRFIDSMKNRVLVTLIIVVVLVHIPDLFAQNDCSNIDFESGDLSEWTTQGNVSLVNGNQLDPYGGFSLALSGNHAVQLGNHNSPVYTAPYHSSVSRSIVVTEESKFFIYGFAIVMLGYPHDESSAASVRLVVKDQAGNIVPCTDVIEYAEPQVNEGFIQSNSQPEGNFGGECCFPIFYKPWETVAIDLSNYIGETLSIEIISEWCLFDVDWAYAYFDAYCNKEMIKEECADGHNVLTAIDLFQGYSWSGPGLIEGESTNQVSVNETGTYYLQVPSPSPSCPPLEVSYEVTSTSSSSLGPVPNVITANGDGVNDELIIPCENIDDYEIVIVNRWGNMVYESNDPFSYWNGMFNGEYVNEGSYFYKIQYQRECAFGLDTEQGFVSVIR